MARRTGFAILAAALLAAALLVRGAIPPATAAAPAVSWTPAGRVVRGAFHVHSIRSDGTGSADEIAEAARRAGLQFVIMTDHGDATRPPDPPAYRAGVLCLDAVEISTAGGHYVALGLPAAPYRLGGEARDVVADVARLGGFGVAAHPGSPREELRWRDWTLPTDGIEWLNADSEWRDESVPSLARALLGYGFRRPQALVTLFDRPDDVLRRADAALRHRRLTLLAAADAHARTQPDESGPAWNVPAYESVFRAFAIRAVLDADLSGDAGRDTEVLLGALRRGRVYTAIDALAAPASFEFTASSGPGRAVMGDSLRLGASVVIEARASVPAGGEIQLYRNGTLVARGRGETLVHRGSPNPGAYRVEVHLPGAPGTPPVPWILSSPIYVGEPAAKTADRQAVRSRTLFAGGGADGWSVEHPANSRAAVDSLPARTGRDLAFRYALGTGGAPAHAALTTPVPADFASSRALFLRLRSDRPMRLGVQVRAGGAGDRRWGRSIYVSTDPREVWVWFDDMTGLGHTDPLPPPARVSSLLFVVDTLHTPPGRSGVVWFEEIGLGR
jgi:hypothetical protein